MSDASQWLIPADAPDWECGWEGDEVFHLRYFRALSLPEKIRAVEQMEQVAAFFAKSSRRRRPSGQRPGGAA
jgi:hypothetical protein